MAEAKLKCTLRTESRKPSSDRPGLTKAVLHECITHGPDTAIPNLSFSKLVTPNDVVGSGKMAMRTEI